ncbi:hypothetical protein [Pantoea eucrina]|uniref:hypothetical protein n=1 Tax=Pantoea eucrina TaxID=472693 RepID=UPI00080F54EB|nr:hypothetical protein [Pantoea eucrina]
MSLKPIQKAALWRRIERYRDAMIDDANKGGLVSLEERDEVEIEAADASRSLLLYIERISAKPVDGGEGRPG